MLTHQVIKEITKTMNEVNFAGFETRVRSMIITLMEQPLRKMQQNDEVISKLGDSLRKNIRRTHEMEFII